MLRKIRIAVALISFALITLLFLDSTGVIRPIAGWLPKAQVIPAILSVNLIAIICLLAITLVLGRVYCSILCPLGIFQDFVNRLAILAGGKKRLNNRFRYRKGLTLLRVAFLLLFVAVAVAGFTSIAALIDPYSEYGRMLATVSAPVGTVAIIIAASTFAVVFTMALLGGRIYCNTLCPVGTLLGFISRFAWLKPVIDSSKCNLCGKCARRCKASCIDSKNHNIDYSRCVACMDCISNCSQGAISFTRAPRRVATECKPEKVNNERRNFLAMVTTISGVAALSAVDRTTHGAVTGLVDGSSKSRIPALPAGAASLKNFSRHCTACQLCVTECPQNILKPSMSLERLMQPSIDFDNGFCDPSCTACSHACPSGALRPVSVSQKRHIQIGLANVDLDRCLEATGEAPCSLCARNCPLHAIEMKPVPGQEDLDDAFLYPAVDAGRCIGCGVCHSVCPARPVKAISVMPLETHRRL